MGPWLSRNHAGFWRATCKSNPLRLRVAYQITAQKEILVTTPLYNHSLKQFLEELQKLIQKI